MKHGIIGLVAIVKISLISCGSKTPVEKVTSNKFVLTPTMQQGMNIEVAATEPLMNELRFFGKISADNNKMIEVYPVVGGNVTAVYVELGDYVNKGQLLATIRSTEVAGFEKELDDARNDLTVAKNKLKVQTELFEGKLITEREVTEARSELDKAQSQWQRIQETYRIYNIKPHAIYEVRAPLSGFIVQKNINQDMLLRSDKSDNIFDIAQIDDVWALANVNESEISEVKMGVNAEITTLSYPDKVFYGKVDKIFNVIDPETKAMKARVKLNNANYLLKPDMRATIKLYYNEDRTMVAIPKQALIFDKSKYYVMVYKNAHDIETREVQVCRQTAQKAYIEQGIASGEKIITKNQLLIYDAIND